MRRYLKNANAIFPLKIDDFGAFLRDLPKMKLNLGKEEVKERKKKKIVNAAAEVDLISKLLQTSKIDKH